MPLVKFKRAKSGETVWINSEGVRTVTAKYGTTGKGYSTITFLYSQKEISVVGELDQVVSKLNGDLYTTIEAITPPPSGVLNHG